MPPVLQATADEDQSARPWLDRLGAGFLAIHPGSGSPRKNWPADRFAVLADTVAAGRPWLLVEGPADRDAAARLASLPGVVHAADLPVRVLGALLAHARLYVGNDSGVSHLAGAVGAAGLALFGPTQAGRWRPLAGSLTPLQALGTDPEGIPLAALPPALVVAECERIGGRLGGARPRSPVDKGGPRY